MKARHWLLVAIAAACTPTVGSAESVSDPCRDLPPYLVDVHELQRSLIRESSSDWKNIVDNYERSRSGSSGGGGGSFLGLSLKGAAASSEEREARAMSLNSGSLTAAQSEYLKEYVRTVSSALAKLVDNCTSRRDVIVVYAQQNARHPSQFSLHITFNPVVGINSGTAHLIFSHPVTCTWDTTDSYGTKPLVKYHVPLRRPDGAIAQCSLGAAKGVSLGVTAPPIPVLNVMTTEINPPAPKPRWSWIKKIPAKNVDGRHTAYIKIWDDGGVTSDPLPSALDSHVGYTINIPHRGSYVLLADFAAGDSRTVAVTVGGKPIVTKTFPPSNHPDVAQTERVAVLDLEAGAQLIDLFSKSAPGLPKLFVVTLAALPD